MAKHFVDITGYRGLTNNFDQASTDVYIGAEGQIAEGIFNPFLRRGYLSPSTNTLTTVTVDTSMDSVPYSSFYDAVSNDFYLAGADRQMYKGDGTSDTTLTLEYTSPTSTQIKDLEAYMVNGVRKMFVVYKDASGDCDIAISDFPYNDAADDETWLSATVSGAFSNDLNGDAFLIVADNSFAYLCMENQVHRIDGTTNGGANGTVEPNVLLFPPFFRIVDGVDTRGNIWLGIHQYTNDTRAGNPSTTIDGKVLCGVYIWDRQSTVVTTRDYVPLEGVQEISKIAVSPNGAIRVWVINTEGVAEIREYNGSTFVPIQRIGFGGYPHLRDSYTSFNGMSVWNGRNGITYGYGSPFPGEPEGLFQLNSVSVASTHHGVLIPAIGSASTPPALYLGYQSITPATLIGRFKVHTLTSQLGTDTAKVGEVYSLLQMFPLSKINYVRVWHRPGTGSGSTQQGTFKTYINQNTTSIDTTITNDDVAKGYKYIPINQGTKNAVFSLQFQVDWAGTEMAQSTDWNPRLVEVDYDLIEKKK